MLIATDLDRTMIYSRRAIDDPSLPWACVELQDGTPASFMTPAAAAGYADLAARTVLVPVTTRIPDQYARLRLPGPPPRFAIASNGGVLYVDGVADRDWARTVAASLADTVPLTEVWAYVGQACDPAWTKKVRNADGLFCYAIVHPDRIPAGFVADVTGWAAERGWRTSLQGRKLYWVPERLSKSTAVAEIARRIDADRILAAGDSQLDVDLLLAADRAIHPRHGELFEQGWSAPRVEVTAAAGPVAGEQIVQWFAQTLSDVSGAAAR